MAWLEYGEAKTSGMDEKIVRGVDGECVMSTKAFAATLKMERGRFRVKRGRPVRSM